MNKSSLTVGNSLALIALTAVFMFLLMIPYAHASSYSGTPTKDVSIWGISGQENLNHESSVCDLSVGHGTSNYGDGCPSAVINFPFDERSILQFSHTIPAKSTIISAYLYLYTFDNENNGGWGTYTVYLFNKMDWIENQATYNNYSSTGTWSPGASNYVQSNATLNSVQRVRGINTERWIEWNVTNLVQNISLSSKSTIDLLIASWPDDSFYGSGLSFRDSENATYSPFITVLYTSPPTINVTLSGLDCGNMWISSDPTVLGVTASLTNVNSSVTKIAVKFNDTLNTVEAEYNISNDKWSLLQGENIISMTPGIYTRTNSSSTNYTYTTIFKFIGLEPIQDAKYRQVYVNYTYSNGSGASYSAKSELFTIYNLGGQTEWQSWGNAGLITGGDTFAIYAEGNETDLLGTSSWVQVNQTWVRLQHFHAQMSIKLNLNGYGGEGEDQLWQDYDHSDPTGCYGNPCEYYLDAYNWRLKYMISYYDEVNHMWVDGWYIMLSMQQGDISSTAEWTQINATMYNGPAHTKMDSQLFNAWIEREPEAKIRLWVDLWFNQANSSRVHASRANAMYFGIIGSGGWWVWTPNTWEPQYQNQSQSTSFEDLLDANSNVISSSQLKCMVVSETLFAENYVEHETLPFDSFTVRVADWDSLDFNLAPTKIMRGTGTPMFNTPLMPDLAPTGLLGAIASAIQGIGGFFVKALQSLFAAIWASLGQQFPWFTGSIESMYKLINALFIFFPMIMNGFSSILTLIGSQFWLFSVLGDSMNQVFAMISYWVYLFPPSTYNSLILLGVILVIILPFSDKLGRGDLKGIKQDLGDAWHIINVIMDYGLRLITTIVNWILRVLP